MGTASHDLRITRITVQRYSWEAKDLGTDYNGFNQRLRAGQHARRHTRLRRSRSRPTPGSPASTPAGTAPPTPRSASVARYLLGQEPARARAHLQRPQARAAQARPDGHRPDRHRPVGHRRQAVRRAHLASCWAAGSRPCPPTPAPTTATTRTAGSRQPEAFAEFAVQCQEMGYPAFKIHGWGQTARSSARSRRCWRRASAVGDRDGPDDRPGLRVQHLGRDAQGRAGLRRGATSSGSKTRTRTAASRRSGTASCARSSRRRS